MLLPCTSNNKNTQHHRYYLFLIPLFAITACSQHPHLSDSKDASSQRIYNTEANAEIKTSAAPKILNIHTAKETASLSASQPLARPQVNKNFNFDDQLTLIAKATTQGARKALTMQYLMQAWNLGPDGFEQAKKRLGTTTLTTNK